MQTTDHADANHIQSVHRNVARPCRNFADGEGYDNSNQDKLANMDFGLVFGIEKRAAEETHVWFGWMLPLSFKVKMSVFGRCVENVNESIRIFGNGDEKRKRFFCFVEKMKSAVIDSRRKKE